MTDKIWTRKEIEDLATRVIDGTASDDEVIHFGLRYYGNVNEAEWKDDFSDLKDMVDIIRKRENKILADFKEELAKSQPTAEELEALGFYGEDKF